MYATAHSYYSLRYGTLSEEALAAAAKQCGFPAMALTDINNSSAVFPFVKACRQEGIQPLAGMEFRKHNRWLYTGLARNPQGFRELNEYLTWYNLQDKLLLETAGNFDHAFIIYPLSSGKKPEQLKENEFLGVQPSEVNRTVLSVSKKVREKLVIQAPATYRDAEGLELHRHLRAIDSNILLSQLQPEHGLAEDAFFRPIDQLREQYAMLPGIWENTEKLLQQCDFTFEFEKRRNKQTFTGSWNTGSRPR